MILITGVFGHLGLSTALKLSSNYKIVGIYNNTVNKYYKKVFLKNKIILIKNNLTNSNQIKQILKKYKIEQVLYCSAIAHDSIAKKKKIYLR